MMAFSRKQRSIQWLGFFRFRFRSVFVMSCWSICFANLHFKCAKILGYLFEGVEQLPHEFLKALNLTFLTNARWNGSWMKFMWSMFVSVLNQCIFWKLLFVVSSPRFWLGDWWVASFHVWSDILPEPWRLQFQVAWPGGCWWCCWDPEMDTWRKGPFVFWQPRILRWGASFCHYRSLGCGHRHWVWMAVSCHCSRHQDAGGRGLLVQVGWNKSSRWRLDCRLAQGLQKNKFI